MKNRIVKGNWYMPDMNNSLFEIEVLTTISPSVIVILAL